MLAHRFRAVGAARRGRSNARKSRLKKALSSSSENTKTRFLYGRGRCGLSDVVLLEHGGDNERRSRGPPLSYPGVRGLTLGPGPTILRQPTFSGGILEGNQRTSGRIPLWAPLVLSQRPQRHSCPAPKGSDLSVVLCYLSLR